MVRGLIGIKFSHMVFLVLDHFQDNPLFRAPVGESPKVMTSYDGRFLLARPANIAI